MSAQYVYLIQEREFIKTSENIFKIGKSKQENNKRINQYPKQSKLLLQIVCDNCDILEKELIISFKNKYNHRKDIGNEYFEGDFEDMIKNFFYIRNNIDDIINYEKIEKEKTQEELNRELLKKENDIKIQEEKKLLLKQEKEFSIQKKELLKELITKQKENEKKQKELIKQAIIKEKQNLKQIENEKKELEKIENEIKKKELQKLENEIKKKELEKIEDEIIKEKLKNEELEKIENDIKKEIEVKYKLDDDTNIVIKNKFIENNLYYQCKRCNYKTNRFSNIVKHINIIKQCNRTEESYNYSNDQILILSLFPYVNKNISIDENQLNHLKNSNDIIKYKDDILLTLCIIDKKRLKICSYCSQQFIKILDLKKHILTHCFYIKLKKENKLENQYNN